MFDYNELVVKYSKNYVPVLIPQDKVSKIKGLVSSIIEKKSKENHHQIDKYKEYKRFFNGLMGEAAVEQLLNINIIDWAVGNSKNYNIPDIKEYNVGIKTVERDKFPIIFKENKYSQIICVKNNNIPNLVFVCGLATPEILNKYQSDTLILSPNLKARGTKTGFFGFSELKQFKNKDEFESLMPSN